MSYDLHIQHAEMTEEEEPVPILLEEWGAAVAATEGVRLFSGEVHTSTILGPRVIRIRATEGDAEVWFPRDGQWYWAFSWQGGSASFPARFEPGDMSHPVWAAAVSLASRLGAVIRGDEGETYDLQTGQARSPAHLGSDPSHSVCAGTVALVSRLGALFRGDREEPCDLQTGQVSNSAAVPRQEMRLVFAPKGIRDRDVIEAAQRLFVKHGIPPSGFEFDGVASELEISKRIKRRTNPPTEVKGHGFTIRPASYVASWHLSRADIEAETPIQIPWDEWVIELFNESFVMAWVADSDYQFWQSAMDVSHYKAFGRPWKHLPLKPSGLPPPLEQTMVDTSQNPGRRVFHVGFIEAVGAIMWFGERFWQVSGASKQRVLLESWLQCAEIVPGLLRVHTGAQCFSTDQGEAGGLQRKLRALLFPVRPQR